MAQTTNDIKNGSVLNLDGQLWTVMKFQHVKPGKGPAFVRTTIEPGLQGNRSNAGTKPATVETGAEIQVPLFINEGDRVKINTEDGSYTGRENN